MRTKGRGRRKGGRESGLAVLNERYMLCIAEQSRGSGGGSAKDEGRHDLDMVGDMDEWIESL